MKKDRITPGFYIEYGYSPGMAHITNPNEFNIIYIDDNKMCKYIHFSTGGPWSTLLWTCAPTIKQLANSGKIDKQMDWVKIVERFDTHQDLLSSKYGAVIASKYPAALNHP